MTIEILKRLEMLNQLALTETEEKEFLEFYAKREADTDKLSKIDTDKVERMVHVMPLETVVRDDVVIKNFSREELQKQAPETDEGYWCVPKVME